jgi:kynureninase
VALTGALDTTEVTPMGSLTTNLHLMMVSFYQPTKQRYKIIMESGAFPSDQYAFETQCRFHGFDPDQAIIEIAPAQGHHTLDTAHIVSSIQEQGDQLALVLLSGVQYYSGQLFDIEKITSAGHDAGAKVGWDLAHAIGNVPLYLNEHQVDFAVWCSYKYLNSGPGGTAGIFVHQRHHSRPDLPRFGGWWGYPEQQRFEMKKGFEPMAGSDGWQLSNANVLSMASQKASLDLFLEAGIDKIRGKSLRLTGYLEFLLDEVSSGKDRFRIITPGKPDERGAQLSLLFSENGTLIFKGLADAGVVVDWREPNLIRVAPAPLYNTFEEVYQFCQILKTLIT